MDNETAVETLAEIISESAYENGTDCQEAARGVLASFRAAPMAYVKPKPLEWKGEAHNTYADRGPFTYVVQHVTARIFEVRRNGHFVTAKITLEAAQAAAYEDLCKRVGELY